MEHIMCSELLSVASYDRITEFLIFGLWIPSPGTSLFSPFGWLCRIVPMHCSFGNLSDKCSQVLICSLPSGPDWASTFLMLGPMPISSLKKEKKKNPPKETPNLLRNVKNVSPIYFPCLFPSSIQASIRNVMLIWDESAETSQSTVRF